VTSPELSHSRIAILGYFFILDVSMNGCGARLELGYGRPG
jgi:hypothetical protein